MSYYSTMKLPSGKFVLRVDPPLHLSLRNEADENDMSLNDWIVHNLSGSIRQTPLMPIVHRLQRHLGSDLIGIVQFGSSVRREMRSNSDIDLLIVLDKNRPISRSLYADWDKKMDSPKDDIFSPQFSHLPKFCEFSSLWLEVAIEGEILFDTNERLFQMLLKIRGAIAAGMYQRKLSHGHPYWIKIKDGEIKDAK
jgi:predicted nucleotidyltransferase